MRIVLFLIFCASIIIGAVIFALMTARVDGGLFISEISLTPEDRIRSGFSDFGYPIDEFTDQEIRSGAERAAQAAQEISLRSEEAAKALGRLERAMPKCEDAPDAH